VNSATLALSELPSSWLWVTLSDIGQVASGGTPSTREPANFNGEIAWITPADLTGHKGKFVCRGRRNLSEKGLKSSGATLLPKGTILFSSRAPIGYVAIAKNPISTNQGFKNLVPSSEVFNEYIFYYLKGSRELAHALASGTTFKELSARKFAEISLPLPPLPEQKRIVAKIEELFTRLDAGVEALKKVKTQLGRYRQAVLKHAFEGKLTADWREAHKDELEPASRLLERIRAGKLQGKPGKRRGRAGLLRNRARKVPAAPWGWVWKELSDVGRVTTGTTPPRKDFLNYGVDVPFVKPPELRDCAISDGEEHLSWKGAAVARIAPPNSVLVSCIGILGKTGLNTVPVAFNQQINTISFYEGILPRFGLYYFQSPYFRRALEAASSATTVRIVNKSKFSALRLPLPPLAEQERIVEEIERRFSVADLLDASIQQALSEAESLRRSILKRAFQGKLVPQDPNDPPATELLERIRAEKAKLEAPPGRKTRTRKRRRTVRKELI